MIPALQAFARAGATDAEDLHQRDTLTPALTSEQ